MADSYSANLKLATPAVGDPNWNVELDRNRQILDAQNAIGDLAVTTHEQPSASLAVDISAGLFVNAAGTVTSYGGVTGVLVAAGATTYFYLTASGTLAQSTTGFPASPTVYVPLATVLAGGSSITSITDGRVPFSVVGIAPGGGGGGGMTGLSGDVVANGTGVVPALVQSFNNGTTFGALAGQNSVLPAQLPNPSTAALGGVHASAAVANQWVNSISTTGAPQLSQPAFSNLLGTVAVAQLPVFAGSGTGHAAGIVPDPGATAGTSRYLREDGSWFAPPGGGGGGTPGGAANQLQWNNAGVFAGLTIGGDATLVASTGILTISKLNGQPFAPSATSDTTNAVNITQGVLPAGRLPAPTQTTLGGVQATPVLSNQWVNGINASGVPQFAQVFFTNIGGAVQPSQMPLPTATTLGGVLMNIPPPPHSWVYGVDGTGTLRSSQASFSDIGGTAAVAQLPALGASGTGHSAGIAPDPGPTAGTSRFLREDNSWAAPPGGTGGSPGGSTGQLQWNNAGVFAGTTLIGDVTFVASTGVVTVGSTNGAAFARSATVDATNAGNINAGTLPAARLPNPTTTSLGGVQAAAPLTNQWMTGIGTTGVPSFSQPSFSNLSGTLTAAQLPAPTTTTLGGIMATAGAANSWIAAINGLGVPQLVQPGFASIAGQASLAQLPAIANGGGLVNLSGATGPPQVQALTTWLDSSFGATQGSMLYRGASTWVPLPPAPVYSPLMSGGPSNNVFWNQNVLLPANGPLKYMAGPIFSCGLCNPVSNTTAVTSLLLGQTSARGTLTIPANTLVGGSMLHWFIYGVWGSIAPLPTFQISVNLGATTVLINPGTSIVQAPVTGQPSFLFNGQIGIQAVGASGSVGGASQCILFNVGGTPTSIFLTPYAGAPTYGVAINTTIANTFGITLSMSVANVSNNMQIFGFQLYLDNN